MKNTLITLLLCMVAALQLKAQNTASKADQTQIINTISAETGAYVKRDSTLLMSFYTDDVITQAAWNQPNGSYGLYKGYKSIKQNFSNAFRLHPEPVVMPKVDRTDWFFRPLGKGWMWVNFIQKSVNNQGKLYTSYETRIMKWEDAKWKIAVMYALSNHGHTEE
jgi:hypothetical protein